MIFIGYERDLKSNLPQLEYLDGRDRYGNTKIDSDTNVPGIDEFLDYLLSNGGETDSLRESNTSDIITPKIDKAMEMYRLRHQRNETLSSSSETSMSQSKTAAEVNQQSARNKSKKPVERTVDDNDERLVLLEQQIAQLLSKTKTDFTDRSSSEEAGRTSRQIPTKDIPERDDCLSLDSDPGTDVKESRTKRPRKSKLPSYRKSTAASRAKKDSYTRKEEVTGETTETRSKSPLSRHVTSGDESENDKKIRNDIRSDYTQMMQELEKERERRWKAEAAAKKLVEHIQKLSTKAKEDGDMKELAIDATSRLKHTVMNEREVKLRLQEENQQLKEQLQDAVEHLSRSKTIQDEQTKAIKQMEEMCNKEERERMKQQTHEHKKLQEALMKSAALSREVDLLKNTCDSQKTQIQSLQSLLANREQEHREELKGRYGLGSKEMQAAVQEEVKRLEREHHQQMKSQQDKIEELSKQYSGLEDEFRQALQIESSRFEQLKNAFEIVSEENSCNKTALLAAQRKDEKSSEMLNELTSMVKEQKGRITELTKSKQEQNSQYRERVNILEAHVEEARKRMVQFELLKQDNIKLKSQVHGQESVIEGLRAERKLWEQELAQQGASLAQDRGSLEAKLEAQKSEISMLKKQLERETDGLKIKTKMLEDQTETIRKLKEGVEERDTEIKKCRHENLKIQQNLEDQLSEERSNNQDTQEMLERLRERKQDLKHQLSEVQKDLDESRKAHSVLNNRWKEKSQLIGQLESQVREMKDSWEMKEKKLTQERDKALEAANLAIDRLKSADDAFRKQLEDKVQAYQDQMSQLEQDKQQEIDQAYLRIAEVEEEMRELLSENQAAKKGTEEKIKRLTQAMTDLQSDLYQ
ncbi:leucine rich repeat [Mactra antiquata]